MRKVISDLLYKYIPAYNPIKVKCLVSFIEIAKKVVYLQIKVGVNYGKIYQN